MAVDTDANFLEVIDISVDKTTFALLRALGVKVVGSYSVGKGVSEGLVFATDSSDGAHRVVLDGKERVNSVSLDG